MKFWREITGGNFGGKMREDDAELTCDDRVQRCRE